MSLTIDDLSLSPSSLGLATIGDVLSHVAKENRLVVQLLIDGSEPDLSDLPALRLQSLEGKTLFLETALPQQIASDVLNSVTDSLGQADEHRVSAAESFRSNDPAAGMQKLALCFSLWQHTQSSITQVAQLLQIDPESIRLSDGSSLQSIATNFASALKQLKEAIEARDYVLCTDVLTYDMETTSEQWSAAAKAIRQAAKL